MLILKLGSRDAQVSALQEGLAYLGFHPGSADGIFGSKTERAVVNFQNSKRIFADGIVGPTTASTYNEALERYGRGYRLTILIDANIPSKVVEPVTPSLKWVKCPADIFEDRGGYNRTTLRSDVAVAYKALYEEVHSLGGIITSAGGRRSLASKSSPSRSKKSMHYVGRAFDMALPTGMRDPNEDPFICERDQSGNGRLWTIWCRTENPDIPIKVINASYVTSHRNKSGKRYTSLRSKAVSARMFNFTELAKSHGFERISSRRSFFNGGSYGGAEWWHFQYERDLAPEETTFGEELLKVYSLEKCESFVYWGEVKNCKWKVNWF